MYMLKKYFKKFSLDDQEDMDLYQHILNDPLCNITEKTIEREKVQSYNDRGSLTKQSELLYFIIHWEKKEL